MVVWQLPLEMFQVIVHKLRKRIRKCNLLIRLTASNATVSLHREVSEYRNIGRVEATNRWRLRNIRYSPVLIFPQNNRVRRHCFFRVQHAHASDHTATAQGSVLTDPCWKKQLSLRYTVIMHPLQPILCSITMADQPDLYTRPYCYCRCSLQQLQRRLMSTIKSSKHFSYRIARWPLTTHKTQNNNKTSDWPINQSTNQVINCTSVGFYHIAIANRKSLFWAVRVNGKANKPK